LKLEGRERERESLFSRIESWAMGSFGEEMRDLFSKGLEEYGRLNSDQPPLQV